MTVLYLRETDAGEPMPNVKQSTTSILQWLTTDSASAIQPKDMKTAQGSAKQSFTKTLAELGTAHYAWWKAWISPPLNGDQTIAGTLTVILDAVEGNAAKNAFPRIFVYVWKGDDSGIRGTLFSNGNSATEEGTSEADTTYFNAVTLTSVNALSGDRIVIEIMEYHNNTKTASYADTLYFNGGAAPGVSRLNFSQILNFGILKEVTDSLSLADAILSDKIFAITDSMGLADVVRPIIRYHGCDWIYNTDWAWGYLDSSSKKWSNRFTAPATKTVSQIRVYINVIVGTPPTYRFGLQGDNNGVPNGSWLNGNAYGDFAPTATGWLVIDIPDAGITGEIVYHIVVEAVGTPDSANHIRFKGIDPLQEKVPYDMKVDEKLNVVYDQGSGWVVQNYAPIFLLDFTDATYHAQPYHMNWGGSVYGANKVGDQFTENGTYTVAAIGVRIRKAGTPPDDLLLCIYNVTDSEYLIQDQVFCSQGAVTTSWSWVWKKLSTPVTLVNGKQYKVYFKSPNSNSANYYEFLYLQTENSAPYRDRSWGGVTNLVIYGTDEPPSSTYVYRDVPLCFNIDVPITDAVGLTDTISLLKLLEVLDSLGLSDAVLRDKALQILDSLGLAEQIGAPSKQLISPDAVTLADTVLRDKILAILDSLTLSEVIQTPLRQLISTDSISLSDAIEVIMAIIKYVTDAIGLSEQIGTPLKQLIAADSIALTDLIYALKTLIVADNVNISDQTLVNKILTILDSLGLLEAIYKHWVPVVSDSVGLSDAVLGDKILRITDAVNLIETILTNKQFAVIESVSLSDIILILKAFLVTDAISLQDAIEVTIQYLVKEVLDSIGLSDAVKSDKTLQVLDAVSVTELILRDKPVAILDIVALADLVKAANLTEAPQLIVTKDGKLILRISRPTKSKPDYISLGG